MDALFLTILNMSLTGAFVITVICLARQLLKKAPKVISYALWAVAGFRLMFPVSIESFFSLMPFYSSPIPANIAMQTFPQINSGIPAVNNAVGSVLPAAVPFYSANPLQIWIAIGAWVWFFGAASLLVYGIVSFFILKRKMRNAVPVESNIYKAVNIKSPFVLGIVSPKIFLPAGLSDHERRYILLHEQTHIRRYDHIVKFAAYFVLCLHWFNPLAWLAFWLMGADMEMSCDERVMKELGNDISKDYSMSLVRIAVGRRILASSPLAFSEGGIKERVKRVLNFKKPARMIIVAAAVLAVILSVGLAMNRISSVSPGDDELDATEIIHADDPALSEAGAQYAAIPVQIEDDEIITNGTTQVVRLVPNSDTTISMSQSVVISIDENTSNNTTGVVRLLPDGNTTAGYVQTVSAYVKIGELAPDEEIAVARIFVHDDVSYEVTVSSETGSRILVGLQPQRTPGMLRYSASVSTENPRTTVIPFDGSPTGTYYLHIANHDTTVMTEITICIIPSGTLADVELLDFTT
jgi:beta-lactamase regulating signal transducer with metallopeptidase domain